MFGSSSGFGQPSSSPFGSSSVFGQSSGASSNPFAANPFGSSTLFGSQTGSSIFSGTSTGVFGATSSPFSSTTGVVGVSSSPAFGSSIPAFGSSIPAFGGTSTGVFGPTSSTFPSSTTFGASSSPAFSSSNATFGSSTFRQTPAFGGFGSTPAQASPFGSSTSQPAFGSSIFSSSTPFGASSQSAFGAISTPAFGASSTLTFGASSTPAFGATSALAFGASAASTRAFGTSAASTPAFGISGASTPAFGATSSPAFGTSTFGSMGSAFGASSGSVFGTSGAFGAPSTPAFGASVTGVFGVSSTPSFSFGSSPSFGQSSSAFGSSSPFGSSTPPFGTQSSSFGAQSSTPAFGGTTFGQATSGSQGGGSRVTPYMATTETDVTGTQPAGKLMSISAMPAYKDKSHEELRWEDYQRGDKGGPLSGGQTASGFGFSSPLAQPNPFFSTPKSAQQSPNPFSSSIPTNPFAPKPAYPSFGSSSASTFTASPFNAPSSSPLFGSTSQSIFGSSSTYGTSSSAPLFGSSPSPFKAAAPVSAPSFCSGMNFGNTHSSPLFAPTMPTFGQQPAPGFGQATPVFGSTSIPSSGQSSIFNIPSSGLFSSTSSLVGQSTLSFASSFQATQPVQASAGFGISFGQTPAGGFSSSSIFGQSNFGQSVSQNSGMVQAPPVTNPFGTLPAMPQMPIDRTGNCSSVQFGVSCMPVANKPDSIKLSSLLAPYYSSQRRVRLPRRKYHPYFDVAKAMFFTKDDETPSTPKADAFFTPRENPRTLTIHPIEYCPWKASRQKPSLTKTASAPAVEDGINPKGHIPAPCDNDTETTLTGQLSENGPVEGQDRLDEATQKSGVVYDDHSVRREDASGHVIDDAEVAPEHGADVELLMPKLRHSDYYTKPSIEELAAKEEAEPGFCGLVKDFMVGRAGYGSVRFFGETDVRGLDLDSLIQFNNREVIVYMDDSKKPPVGQGLNKPAEVTLLNIKCFDKRTGQQLTEGPKIEKFKEMLRKKAKEQGAEFVSHDPVNGEWRFRVEHFSIYKLEEEEKNVNDRDGHTASQG